MKLEQLTARWVKRNVLANKMNDFSQHRYDFSKYDEFGRDMLSKHAKSPPLANLNRNITSLQNQIAQQKKNGVDGRQLNEFANSGVNKIERMFKNDVSAFLSGLHQVTSKLKKAYETERGKASNVQKILLQNQEANELYSVISDKDINTKQKEILTGNFDGTPHEVNLVLREAGKREISMDGLEDAIEKHSLREPWLRNPEGDGIKELVSYYEDVGENDHVVLPIEEDGKKANVGFRISSMINMNPTLPDDEPTFQERAEQFETQGV